MSRPLSSAGRLRAAGAATIFAAVAALVVAFAPAASAHHPDITGSTACADAGYTVSFTSTSWQQYGGDSSGGANPHIAVYYRFTNGPAGTPTAYTELPWKPSYKYTAANGYQFGDSFPVADLSQGDRIQLKAVAASPWGNGVAAGAYRETDWITFPTDCARPGTPDVSSKVDCVDGDGTVTVTLQTIGGNVPTTFVVTDPRTNTNTTRSVAPGTSQTVTLTGVADGSLTIPVTADGVHQDQTVQVACDRPGIGSVQVSQGCADFDGTVTLTLATTGGDLPVTFVVTDPRTNTTTTKVVAPGATDTVTLTGVADGSFTVPVTVDGVHQDQTVQIDCDRPGTPATAVDVRCTETGGTVVVTLRNTSPAGTAEPIDFTVQDPNGGTAVVRTVAAGDSAEVSFPNQPDGTLSLAVTADGNELPPVVATVDCQKPGVADGVISCVEGGWVVTLTNSGPTPVPLSVRKNGTEVQKVTVPGEGSIEVLIPLAKGETATITIVDDTTVVDEATVTNDCTEPTTTTSLDTITTSSTPSSSSPSSSTPDTAQVLGESVTKLPATGASTTPFAVAGVALLGLGLVLLEASRRRA